MVMGEMVRGMLRGVGGEKMEIETQGRGEGT